jgi:ABC-type glucose/galactose transport system permease subunit
LVIDRRRGLCYGCAIGTKPGLSLERPMRGGSMNLQDKRLWYVVIAVVVVLIIVWALWPAGEMPPAATQ